MKKYRGIKIAAGAVILTMMISIVPSVGKKVSAQGECVMAFCENQEYPEGVQRQPVFSWKVTDDSQGAAQSQYQILVASDIAKLDRNQGDIWDSGIVESSCHTGIIYEGSALCADTKYFYKVRVWGKDGKDYGFSEAASFTTGLFEESDWGGAQWISRDTPDDWWTYWNTRKEGLDSEKRDPSDTWRNEYCTQSQQELLAWAEQHGGTKESPQLPPIFM